MKNYFAHPSYNANLIICDFGVIELDSPFIFNQFTEPISIVAPSTDRLPHGTPLMSSGFGYYQMGSGQPIPIESQFLRFTNLNYVSVSECESIWGTIHKSVQCADKPFASICQGDSGGPLVYEVKLYDFFLIFF